MIGITVAVLLVFAAAAIAPVIYRVARGFTGWLLALVPLALVIYFGSLAPGIAGGQILTESRPWAPALNLNFSFRLDGLGLLFALLITSVGTLILIYAGAYLKGHPHCGRFFGFMLLFMGSMLGLVLADNLVVVYLFWELTTLSSWLLIGFNHESEASRKAAWQSLLVTASGGILMLAGFVLLGQAAGSYELSAVLQAGASVKSSGLYTPILLLVLCGAFTKSAQFPFHFWLPNAMAAPTPVSAYLHSATMVKAGIYLLARLSPALAGTVSWVAIVTAVGGITAVVGGYLAIRGKDFKQLLAYSTISALGTIVLMLGIGTPAAVAGAMVFLLAHAGYKGALFLVAGSVDHETGTRELEKLGGLGRVMPVTAAAAVLAALSLAGAGPLLSFIAKESLYETILHSEGWLIAWIGPLVIVATLFVTAALIACFRPFFGPLKPTPKHPHEAPINMLIPPLLLALVNIVAGFWPYPVGHYLAGPAAGAIMGQPYPLELALWHGFNLALVLSVITTILGIALFVYVVPVRKLQDKLNFFEAWGPEWAYDRIVQGILNIAKWQTAVLQNGYLALYLMTICLTVIGLVVYAGLWDALRLAWAWRAPRSVQLHEIGLVTLMIAGTVVAVRSRSRLGAIAALGVVGYAVALTFALLGAPDLAMTQFLIETLFVVLFVLVFYHLPQYSLRSRAGTRVRDLIVAGSAGLVATILLLALPSVPLDRTLLDYYMRMSPEKAHGGNVVNVILVDFRGFDTMGEITVLAIASIGVFALLKLRLDNREKK